MNKTTHLGRSILLGIVGLIALILLDQWTKYLALTHLAGQDSLILIDGVFELKYLENRGSAFGMFQGQLWLSVSLSIVTLALIGYCYIKLPVDKHFRILKVLGIAVAAGAVGNLIDRLMHGFVVDFFYFSLINFPIFNVADIYLTVSVILLFLLVMFYYKDEDFRFLSLKSSKESVDGEI